MIQDIEPHSYHNEFSKKRPPEGDDLIFIFSGKRVLLRKTSTGFEIPSYGEINSLIPEESKKAAYLFQIDSTGFFYIELTTLPVLEGYAVETTEIFKGLTPDWHGFAGITAYQIKCWYKDNKYCGRCGSEMVHSKDERAMTCSCGNIKYPQIAPAIITGIIDGDKILLTKYAGRSYSRYALIAGFNEIGESLEATVRREVMEEVGLKVKNIRYYKSQPWAFSSSLLAGFFVDLDGDPTPTLDTTELCEATWFKRDELPEGGANISLTHEMIEVFRNNLV